MDAESGGLADSKQGQFGSAAQVESGDLEFLEKCLGLELSGGFGSEEGCGYGDGVLYERRVGVFVGSGLFID